MVLEPGAKLAHYEIVSMIGKGGMGEVYRATDSKLGRDVAIKVLPDEFARDDERLQRFQREAKVLASLNHPNIASIHGLEESSGTHYLVLELVEGETLAERIARGPLPIDEALDIAVKIAEALEEAHERGIVHRDLKPANVKLTPDDKVKVLDFGLAKMFFEDATDADSSMSPTITRDATRIGVILGTAAYMSPEQAKGKRVDKRTDVFAFGAVLYEMLTGERLFEGEDVSDVLAAVLKTEPDWNRLPGNLDPRITKLLRRCLEKDPKKRRRDIGEVRFEIEEALAGPPNEAVEKAQVIAPPSALGRTIAFSVAGALALSALAGGLAWRLKPAVVRPVTRFSLPLGENEQFSFTGRHVVAISPSGTHLVYVANGELNLRAMDQMEATPIRGTSYGRSPFFSPDGQWIGFWVDGALKKVALTGGTPVTLCEAENPYGASWSADGFILYGQGAGGIWRVSENGGSPERLVEVAAGEMAASPEMLPGGTTLLFTLAEAGSSWDDAQIVAQSLATGDRNVLVRGGADARYVSTGHLVYAVGATLMAVAFDAGALEVHGGPAPVVEGVRRSTADTGAAHFTVSDTGALAYVPGSGGLALAQVDRTGQTEPLTERVAVFRLPRLSPVGKRLAVGVQDQSSSDIWILDIARDSLTRLTTEGSNRQPLWSPDGEWIVYTSGDGNLYRIRSDFSGSAELLLDKENEQFAQAWSRDGEWIVFLDIQGEELDLWTLPLGDDGEPRPVVRTPFMEAVPSLSPDGRFIAYHSNESGDYEIYVQPFPEGGRRWPISTEGGMDPVWSADGREIFFRNGSAMMGVSVSTAPEFRVGVPELLFQRPYNYRNGRNYDVAPDGKHFVMIDAAGVTGAERSRVDVVLGWFQELERLVPTD